MVGQRRLPQFKQDLLISWPESKRGMEGTGVLNLLQGPEDLKTFAAAPTLKAFRTHGSTISQGLSLQGIRP